MKNNKSLFITIIAIVILLAVIVVIKSIDDTDKGKKTGQNSNSTTTANEPTTEPATTEEYDVVLGELPETPEDIVTPGKGKLKIEDISGFTATGKNYDFETSDDNLYIEAIGSYSGTFVEDGSDEAIENAMAVVITNKGKKTLQIAQLTITDGTNTYEFQITTIPAKASVLVLEMNKAVYNDDVEYTVKNCSTGYFASTTLMKKKLKLTAADGKITVENISKEDFDKIYIYYKTMKRGGVYMGGITYRVPVENLKSGESQEVVAGHLKEASGHIIMVEAN